MPAKPRQPPDLGPRGRAFWRDLNAAYELDRDELELAVEVARTLDLIETLRSEVAAAVTVAGSKGQPRPHPALSSLLAADALLVRLLASLRLPDLSATTARNWRSRRGA